MIDFIEERTGRMPDLERLSRVVADHGGSGVGLAVLAEAIMAEVVSLHLHLETLDRRQAVLQSDLDRIGQPRIPRPLCDSRSALDVGVSRPAGACAARRHRRPAPAPLRQASDVGAGGRPAGLSRRRVSGPGQGPAGAEL